jgi:L-alanine-DL-glutamate epimerase-like enolase superfamily enzyme
MKIQHIRYYEACIPFTTSFKHGSAERSQTQAVWVEVDRDGVKGVGEGCPREYVTGESLETAERFLTTHRRTWERAFETVDDVRRWVDENKDVVDANPAAWCAAELAYLDLFGREHDRSVEELLGAPPVRGVFRYTAVVGDSDGETFDAIVGRYREMGFSDFKLKLSGDLDRDREKLALLGKHEVLESRVRVDANNLWTDTREAIRHLTALDFAFFGIEEPVASGQMDALREISKATGCLIILDESLVRVGQLELLLPDPESWILNVRVSKMGGVVRSLDVLARAGELGLPVIVGGQVGETSLLTRAGLLAAAAAGESLVGQEGAFGTFLLEQDVCEAPLMFGVGGSLDADALGLASQPGLGIDVTTPRSILQPL